jgi:hypothetical protein
MNIWRWPWTRFAGILIVVGVAILAVTLGSGQGATKPSSGCDTPDHRLVCKVLFVGDSYSYTNDLPAMFASLARAGHHLVETGLVASPAESFVDHVVSQDVTRSLRTTKWNVVALQEQSQIPASERLRRTQMYPAARQLVGLARKARAQPMFFLTWARRYGWPEEGLVTYASMQSAVDQGYLVIAHDLNASVAPVGYVWSATLKEERDADRHAGLWRLDGSHPSIRGTYLAACVFYAAIFGEAPNGLTYRAGLSAEEAAKLQASASKAVLGDPAEWGLG